MTIQQKFSGLTSSFGCEGDKFAPVAFIDGSYILRDRDSAFISFNFAENAYEGKIKWYNAEGWLPCFVTEFSKKGVRYIVKDFADCVDIPAGKLEIAYTRLIVENESNSNIIAPELPALPVCLTNNREKTVIKSKETVIYDFAVAADRFGANYEFPSDDEIYSFGSFDAHYASMKKFWEDRISVTAIITDLPDERLINAVKAGFTYTHIIKDGYELNVGENAYKQVFDHDAIGIVISLLTIGDFKNFKEYAKIILKNIQFPDARRKYGWVFAMYLLKTGDKEYVKTQLPLIKRYIDEIHSDRCDNGTGIMVSSAAIDSNGYWTVDNQSALTGLAAFMYLCQQFELKEEYNEAKAEYDSLLKVCNEKINALTDKYIPISMIELNEYGPRCDVRDANWASMFLFGRWAWDGYLMGAEQYGPMIDRIDATYEYGARRREGISDSPYNFGGYPHGFYSSSYNAGYGSAALRGETRRDTGIKAYQFMLDHSQSGPFGWWEGIGYPNNNSPWDIPHASCGGGSCQHMWGQAVATKVLYDSLIVEKFNQDIIIGRGIPEEWKQSGKKIGVKQYPVANGGRVDFLLEYTDNGVKLILDGAIDQKKIQPDFIDIFKYQISGCTVENGLLNIFGTHAEIFFKMIEKDTLE